MAQDPLLAMRPQRSRGFVFGTKGAPITRTGGWSLTWMIRLSGDGGCSTRRVIRSVSRTGLLSVMPISVAPPAMAMLNTVTAASRIILQFSSRILMPEKRGRKRVVPAGKVERPATGCAFLDETREKF